MGNSFLRKSIDTKVLHSAAQIRIQSVEVFLDSVRDRLRPSHYIFHVDLEGVFLGRDHILRVILVFLELLELVSVFGEFVEKRLEDFLDAIGGIVAFLVHLSAETTVYLHL